MNYKLVETMKKLLFSLGLVLLSFPILAQDIVDEYATDRPGIARTSYVLEPTQFLLEAGAAYSQFDDDADGVLQLGQARLRFGIVDNLEAFAALNSYLSSDAFDNGFQDMSVGLKFNFLESIRTTATSSSSFKKDVEWSLSFAGNLNFPTGASNITQDEVTGEFGLFADYVPVLTEFRNWSFSSNILFFIDDIETNEEFLFTFTPSYNFGDSGAQVYFGYAGFYGEDVVDRYFFELGFRKASLTNSRLAFDINSGYDWNNSGFFIGGGIAYGLN